MSIANKKVKEIDVNCLVDNDNEFPLVELCVKRVNVTNVPIEVEATAPHNPYKGTTIAAITH